MNLAQHPRLFKSSSMLRVLVAPPKLGNAKACVVGSKPWQAPATVRSYAALDFLGAAAFFASPFGAGGFCPSFFSQLRYHDT